VWSVSNRKTMLQLWNPVRLFVPKNGSIDY
jgi:hypothetical protein